MPLSYSVRYAQNMERFIKEIRAYYENRYPGKIAPDAPFVLGTLGEGGWGAKQEKHQNVIDGQLAVDGRTGNHPAFANNVRTAETRGFWRDSSVSPSGQGHHYNLNAETYMLTGDSLGRAMVDLVSPDLTDTDAPEILQLAPANLSLAVRVNSELFLTFSEPIEIGSGNIVLKNLSEGSQTSIPVTDAGQVSAAGYRLTIRPASPLAPNQNYAVRLGSGVIEDAAGNAFAGINDDSTWTFQTIPADVTAPPVPPFHMPLGPVKTNQITVSVDPVVDPEGFPVEYRFRNVTLGTDSGWRIATSWTDTGLEIGTRYVYTVQVRDTSPSMNESADSPLRSTKTLAEAPSSSVVDVFTYKADLGPSGDNWNIDTGGASKPITIATDGFNPVGSDKLVGVISLFNSADSVSQVTSLTFAGVDVLANVATVNPSGSAASSSRQLIFYLDDPATDGDLVIGLGASDNVDEVGVALFALDGTQPGFAVGKSGSGNPAAIDVFSGDFVVGVAQRNNQTQSVTNVPPYTELNLKAGNLVAYVGYTVTTQDGPTAPAFSNTSSIAHSIAVFGAKAPEPSAYEAWSSEHAPTTADDPEGDEDEDSVSNYLEFTLGGSGASNDMDKLPKLDLEADEMSYSFQRDQRSIGSTSSMVIEMGEDLIQWPEVYDVPDNATAGPPVSVVKDVTPGMDQVTLELPMPLPGVERKFMRLKILTAP